MVLGMEFVIEDGMVLVMEFVIEHASEFGIVL